MKRTRIKAKDLQKELITNGYDFKVSKKDAVEILKITSKKDKQIKIVSINNLPSFFYYNINNEEVIIPTLKLLQTSQNLLKHITIDMGAIKFVVGGADIMRPGITKVQEEIETSQPIGIVDETHGKSIAVGIALLNSKEMQTQEKGKSIKNIHFVGDDIWKI